MPYASEQNAQEIGGLNSRTTAVKDTKVPHCQITEKSPYVLTQ